MALNLPDTAAEVDARAKVDVGRELAESNPFLRNSWLGALITAFSNRIFDFYFNLKQAIKEAIPDTAVDNLTRWASLWGITRNPATKSNGLITFTGTILSTVIPASTRVVDSTGKEYSTKSSVALANKIFAVTLNRSGTTVTGTTTVDHGFTAGENILIVGATAPEYNGVFPIIVTGLQSFTYEVSGAPASPDSGTAILSTCATVEVDSIEFGEDQNQDQDVELTLQTPIANVNDDAYVTFGGIGGGTDQETDEEMRSRLLERIQNPIANFNVAQIIETCKSVSGVTRVFVQEITPAIGQVTIYFMRDNDADPIPTASEITDVQNALEAIRPAHTDILDVIVVAPSPQSTDYTFTDLQPNTPSMQAAVTASLEQFYAERTQVGVNIDEDAYRAAIFGTVDPETGAVVLTFTLSAPTGDITIAATEIGTLGNITFP